MKRIFSLMLALMLAFAAASFAGCQPTPEEEVVINKDDGKIFDIIDQSLSPSGEEQREDGGHSVYAAPAEWREVIESGETNLRVELNASVNVPESGAFPVARIEPDEITQQDADVLLDRIVGDRPFIMQPTGLTKDEILQEIFILTQSIEDPNSDFNRSAKGTPEYDALLEEKKKDIEIWQAELANAPEKVEMIEAPREFQLQGEGADQYWVIAGYPRISGARTAYLNIYKPDGQIQRQSVTFFKNQPITEFDASTEDMNGITISAKEAEEIATDFLSDIGIDDMQVSAVCSAYCNTFSAPTLEEAPKCYVFFFTKNVNGIPVTFQQTRLDEEALSEQYAPYWPQESIEIAVDDSGVCGFNWYSPMSIKEIVNDNVSLLPFEKIQEIFRKNIVYKADFVNTDPNVAYRNIFITDIRLGLTKIAEPDSSYALLVPTWSFFGYEMNGFSEPQEGGYVLDENGEYKNTAVGRSFLTINAIDGSVIDRGLGY